jgi:hypothetical protein
VHAIDNLTGDVSTSGRRSALARSQLVAWMPFAKAALRLTMLVS